MSAEDIDSGQRWAATMSGELEQSNAGILCVTKENLTNPWILFEAGALSKQVGESRVIPFLLDAEPSDLPAPLGQFQARRATTEDTRKEVQSLHKAQDTPDYDENWVIKQFERCWGELEQTITTASAEAKKSPTGSGPSEKQMIKEILTSVRSLISPEHRAVTVRDLKRLGIRKGKSLRPFGSDSVYLSNLTKSTNWSRIKETFLELSHVCLSLAVHGDVSAAIRRTLPIVEQLQYSLLKGDFVEVTSLSRSAISELQKSGKKNSAEVRAAIAALEQVVSEPDDNVSKAD